MQTCELSGRIRACTNALSVGNEGDFFILDVDQFCCCISVIDECAENLDVCVSDTNSTCHDLPIGYECRCPEVGYQAITYNYEPCLGKIEFLISEISNYPVSKNI